MKRYINLLDEQSNSLAMLVKDLNISKEEEKELMIILKDETLTMGQTLKKMRNFIGITQEELCANLLITQTAISDWENDKKIPSIINVIKIAEFYMLDLYDVLYQFGIDNPRLKSKNK